MDFLAQIRRALKKSSSAREQNKFFIMEGKIGGLVVEI